MLAVVLPGLWITVVALDRHYAPDLTRLQASQQVLDRHGTVLRAFTTDQGDMWRLPTTADAVDPVYLRMLIAFEDQRFFQHPGIDLLAALRAAGQWFEAGRIVSGASTLSMQTARLLGPRRVRGWRAKAIESLRALQLEAHLGKQGVLNAYLTMAPFGGNLEGVRAGALAWFGKEPKRLTPAEAALLVALPQAPEQRRPDRFPEAAKRARDRVLQRAVMTGVLTAEQAAEAQQDPLPQQRRPMPFSAPHLAERLASKLSQPVIRTSIDGPLQRRLEAMVRGPVLQQLDRKASVAVVVVRLADGAQLAGVGGVDYFNRDRAGALDLTRAARSPGSALKPVLYGLAFEDRILHPETLIADVPQRFGGYQPSNFRPGFSGDVSARDALIWSLNMPAVAVLDRVGPLRMAQRLERSGLKLLFPAGTGRPGLPLALGGVGVTLEGLTGLYAALGAGGVPRPVWVVDPGRHATGDFERSAVASTPVLEPVASWYVADILRDTPRPDGVIPDRSHRPIAYKTGTSYGFRDSWAIGFDQNIAIGVWVGRPDGTPSPGHYGRMTAAPLLFAAFERLEQVGTGSVEELFTGSATGSLNHTRSLARPPPGVFRGGRAALPPALQRFGQDPRTTGRGDTEALPSWSAVHAASDGPGSIGVARGLSAVHLGQTPPPRMVYPPDGAVLDWDPESSAKGLQDSVILSAQGGLRPLRWLINGYPLHADPEPGVHHNPFARTTRWQPDGPGLARITVIDAVGRADHASVKLRIDTQYTLKD